jgi:hypothetical protein
MPDAEMEVLPPLIQRFRTGNVKGPQHPYAMQMMRSFDIDGIG